MQQGANEGQHGKRWCSHPTRGAKYGTLEIRCRASVADTESPTHRCPCFGEAGRGTQDLTPPLSGARESASGARPLWNTPIFLSEGATRVDNCGLRKRR